VAVLKLVLAYDGSGFRGFARQPGHRTVEETLLDALERILGRRPRLSVAGRTDAGVHAEGQVVSLEAEAEPDRLQRALNGMLGPEIAVRRAGRAPAGFDARHSATARSYRYRVRVGQVPDPFTAPFEWHRPGTYGLGPMRRAASLLVGEHDFASFCRPGRGSTVRRLERLAVRRVGEVLEIGVRAGSFLHQMVRSLAGTLLAVGDGHLEAGAIPDILATRDRSAAGPVAPPHGLTLVSVHYGAHPRTRRGSRAAGER
jgi:tRNA pseudouridine38-40 synthase